MQLTRRGAVINFRDRPPSRADTPVQPRVEREGFRGWSRLEDMLASSSRFVSYSAVDPPASRNASASSSPGGFAGLGRRRPALPRTSEARDDEIKPRDTPRNLPAVLLSSSVSSVAPHWHVLRQCFGSHIVLGQRLANRLRSSWKNSCRVLETLASMKLLLVVLEDEDTLSFRPLSLVGDIFGKTRR